MLFIEEENEKVEEFTKNLYLGCMYMLLYIYCSSLALSLFLVMFIQ